MTAFSSRGTRIPARHYKRRHTISQHASDRFRERVDEEFRHRDDEDLGNLLDERVCHAEATYQVRDPRAPDAITTLCSVACRHATYYAVVRNMTVVTVLDEQMARNNFDGQWSPILNAPFEVLRDLKIPPPPSTSGSFTAVPSPSTPPDPLAEAGTAYARARKQRRACEDQRRECEDKMEALKAELERATEALHAAEQEVAASHQRLISLAEGEESESCP